ncbi:hypothetical protein HJFPF1_01277 [Paramyrothecium foliicola]|nr:hypothetical protein HJFPF1_01277 [Paramyrothecium foliicola]
MARHSRSSGWDDLPDEIVLHILSFLEPYYITRLQLVSKKLQEFCLDDELWKRHSFAESSWYYFLKQRRNLQVLTATPVRNAQHPSRASDPEEGSLEHNLDQDDEEPSEETQAPQGRQRELQDMANWDPVFPGEHVSWYNEYIQRQGPACVSWFQTPRLRDREAHTAVEARGLALFNPYAGDDGLGTMLAVSPLDDASVCLWDVNGSRGRQGGILAQSKPGILFFDGPGNESTQRSKRIDTGVTECVSVDNHRNRAFFAVQSHLIEVDLNRLEVVSRESFEWSITTLSPIHEGVPLTVGTSLGIHLHDFRARAMVPHEVVDRVDEPQWSETNVLKAIFDTTPLPPYASLSQPTPISILHLPMPGSHSLVSNDVYVSGRFSNILHYDRRKFPAIVGSIYSGALIKSLAALPYPFSTVDNEVRRMGELSAAQVAETKTLSDGRTLIAGGGYKSKGALEIYGLSSAGDTLGSAMLQNSTLKNRHSAASSTILSVTNHGTKIVFSDGSGLIKWFERDGITECRWHRIGHSDSAESSLFASSPAADDLARKIVSTKLERGNDRPNTDNIMFWTGEKHGLLSFTTAPLWSDKDLETSLTEEEEQSQQYSEQMRKALGRQAAEVHFVSNLGMGTQLP